MFVQITKQFNGMCIPRAHNSGRKEKNQQIAHRNLFRVAISLPYFSSLSPAIQAVQNKSLGSFLLLFFSEQWGKCDHFVCANSTH